MTLPENKVVVQDVTKKIINPRQNMYNQRTKGKPFIFKGYTTEVERIKDTLKNNRYLFHLSEEFDKPKSYTKNISQSTEKLLYNNTVGNMTFSQKYELNKLIPSTKRIVDNKNLNSDVLDYLIKNDIIIQPQMRFKARTDLERVYEALTGNYYRENEREILNRQLKSIDLFTYKKPTDFLKLSNSLNHNLDDIDKNEEDTKTKYKIIPNPNIEEEQKKDSLDKRNIYRNPKIYYVPQNNERWKKRSDLNAEAAGILKEYHQKTHFKATEEIAENKIKTKKKPNNDNNTFEIPYIINTRKRKKRKNIFSFDDDIKKKLKNDEYIPYNKNYNPIKKYDMNGKDVINSESMQILTSMAFTSPQDSSFKNEDSEQTMKVHNVKNKKNLVDENNVLIGNEILYKATQFDLIANRVLKLCNVYQKKNRHNNGSLKKGNGKMMFTQGLSVNQFEKKYDLSG